MRRNSVAALLGLAVALAVVIGSAIDLSAHRRDEYLQAARLAIQPGRVELQLDLTPGIAVAETIIAEIDRDRDGLLSSDEQQAYVGRVLSGIALDVDGQAVHAQPVESTFPTLDALRRGEGTIALRVSAVLPALDAGEHHLSYRNGYRGELAVYLANALVPESPRVAITDQRRDRDQRDLTIDYVLRPERRRAVFAAGGWLAVGVGVMPVWWRFTRARRARRVQR